LDTDPEDLALPQRWGCGKMTGFPAEVTKRLGSRENVLKVFARMARDDAKELGAGAGLAKQYISQIEKDGTKTAPALARALMSGQSLC